MRNKLHSICPYFVMFPEDFVGEHLDTYTSVGDWVLDPFSGRGTTVLEALLRGRKAGATDINPVAYCITGAKAEVPTLTAVLNEVERLELQCSHYSFESLEAERRGLPPFFRRAFYHSTLRQLLFLRRILKWERDPVQRFIAALVLGSLHGETHKSPFYFSNRMPRTISPKPMYSLRYWKEHRLWAPKRDVFRILSLRAHYRLSSPAPSESGLVALADARNAAQALPRLRRSVKAIITSPPYFNVTNYEEDQWLRLWFLDHLPRPTYRAISKDDRHVQRTAYWRFLREAWQGIAPLLSPQAVFVCRLGAKGISTNDIRLGLQASLFAVFEKASLVTGPILSRIHNRQTQSFRPGSRGCAYEADFVFRLS